MNSGTTTTFRRVVCNLDILFGVAVLVLVLLLVLPWEGGPGFAFRILPIVFAYTSSNLGALTAKSYAWRSFWYVLAILGNAAFLVFAARLVFDLGDPITLVVFSALTALVFLNSLALLLRVLAQRKSDQ